MGIGLTDSVTAAGKLAKSAARAHIKKNDLKRHAIAYQELELEKDLDGDGVVGGVGCRRLDRNRLRDRLGDGRADPERPQSGPPRPLPPENRPRKTRHSGGRNAGRRKPKRAKRSNGQTAKRSNGKRSNGKRKRGRT